MNFRVLYFLPMAAFFIFGAYNELTANYPFGYKGFA